MSDWDLAVRGATLVTPKGLVEADLVVTDGTIAAVGANLSGSAAREVDVAGALVLPGIIDAHVHFNEPGRTEWEGLGTGPAALAHGGGTTFVDMPLNSSPPTLDARRVEEKRRLAEGKSVLDFALWGGLTPVNLDRLDELAEAGVVGFKAFMSGSGIEEFRRADLSTLRAGMAVAARHRLPVAVHAEDEEETSQRAAAARAAGRTSWRDYLASRPVSAEVKAIEEALALAGETGCALHVVHVSSAAGVAAARRAKGNGVNVSVETCPHYLLLNAEDVGALGAPAKCAPPLRTAADVGALWEAVIGGEVDTLGSDHSPSPPDLKRADDFFAVWGGIAGCQHGFPLFLEAIHGRCGMDGITLFARLTAENVAARFGLGPRKGGLVSGADADFVVVRFGEPSPVRADDLRYRHRLSPYVGRSCGAHLEAVYASGIQVAPLGPGTPLPRHGRWLRPEG